MTRKQLLKLSLYERAVVIIATMKLRQIIDRKDKAWMKALESEGFDTEIDNTTMAQSAIELMNIDEPFRVDVLDVVNRVLKRAKIT